MSAECSKCGADLDFYLNCDACTQRARWKTKTTERPSSLCNLLDWAEHDEGEGKVRRTEALAQARAALVAARGSVTDDRRRDPHE